MPKYKNRKNPDVIAKEPNVDDEGDNFSEISAPSTVSQRSTETETDGVVAISLQIVEDLVETMNENNAKKLTSLQTLIKIFQKHYFNIDENWNYMETTLDALERLLRKLKPTEQFLPAKVYCLFLLQIDQSIIISIVDRIITIFEPIYRNSHADLLLRSEAVNLVSLCLFLNPDVDPNLIKKQMNYLQDIIKSSCLKGDGNFPNITSNVSSFHIAALQAWSLLYSMVPQSSLLQIVNDYLPKIQSLLKSQFVDMRIAAGITVALIYERIRNEVNSKFKGNGYHEMLSLLDDLSKDSAKFRSKNDRKIQRQSFRDIILALQTDTVEFPTETIKCKYQDEFLLISWNKKLYYDIFCDLFGTGVAVHFAENFVIREIFELGPPIQVDQISKKLSHKQRHLVNQTNSKALKQSRQLNRNKRINALNNFD